MNIIGYSEEKIEQTHVWNTTKLHYSKIAACQNQSHNYHLLIFASVLDFLCVFSYKVVKKMALFVRDEVHPV